MNRIWIISCLFLLSACSTVMDKSTQEVQFETPGARGSMCKVNVGDDVSYKVFPPQKIRLMKTDGTMDVNCYAEGHREKTVIVRPVLSNNTLLNIGTGFAPGFFVDEHTKAHYIYPDVVVIDFTTVPYRKALQPAYHSNTAAPPIQHIDPKRGAVPAISDSDFNPPPQLQERKSKTYYTDSPDGALYQPSKPPPIK